MLGPWQPAPAGAPGPALALLLLSPPRRGPSVCPLDTGAGAVEGGAGEADQSDPARGLLRASLAPVLVPTARSLAAPPPAVSARWLGTRRPRDWSHQPGQRREGPAPTCLGAWLAGPGGPWRAAVAECGARRGVPAAGGHSHPRPHVHEDTPVPTGSEAGPGPTQAPRGQLGPRRELRWARRARGLEYGHTQESPGAAGRGGAARSDGRRGGWSPGKSGLPLPLPLAPPASPGALHCP